MLGLSEVDAKALAEKDGFQLGSVRSYFKANSKALAELDSDGLMKLLFNKTCLLYTSPSPRDS